MWARTNRFGPTPASKNRKDQSVVDFDEIVVVFFLGLLLILVVVLVLVLVLVRIIEDVEGQFDPELGKENVVVGEEGVAQRQLSCFERGVVGLVSIAGDVEVVLEGVQQARQRAARISSHGTHSTVRRRTLSGEVELRTNDGHHEVSSLDFGGLIGTENAGLAVRIKQL